MTYSLRIAQEASEQLVSLQRYISVQATPEIAEIYIAEILAHCEGLTVFPRRGTVRDDLYEGLRTSSFKKRVVIAFIVDDQVQTLVVSGFSTAGKTSQGPPGRARNLEHWARPARGAETHIDPP